MTKKKRNIFSKDSKLRLDIIAVVIAILSGCFGAVEVVRRMLDSPASVEIVEFSIDNPTQGSYPQIKLLLRNTGGSTAFVKKVELLFDGPEVVDDPAHYSTDIIQKRYSWLVTERDVSMKFSQYPLSRKIAPNDVDSMVFFVGFEKLKSALRAKFRLRISYNESQSTTTGQETISIINGPGAAPTFLIPVGGTELAEDLKMARDSWTASQLIEELTARRDVNVKELIRPYLRSPDAKLKVAAANYFTRVQDELAITDLANLLKGGTADISELAYKALLFQGPLSQETVLNLINDDDPRIREIAANMLGDLPGANSELALLRHVDDRGVTQVLGGQPILVAAAAIRSLAKSGSEKLSPQVLELLRSENRSIQLAAIDASAALKVKPAFAILVDLLDSSDTRLRAKAHGALVDIAGKDYGQTKTDWLSPGPAAVRQ